MALQSLLGTSGLRTLHSNQRSPTFEFMNLLQGHVLGVLLLIDVCLLGDDVFLELEFDGDEFLMLVVKIVLRTLQLRIVLLQFLMLLLQSDVRVRFCLELFVRFVELDTRETESGE